MKGEFINLDTVASIHAELGTTPQHPSVGVIELAKVASLTHRPKQFGVYGIVCATTAESAQQSDAASDERPYASMLFFAPGDIGKYRTGSAENMRGWLLVFHPDILDETMIEHYIANFHFFNTSPRNNIAITESEYHIVANCMRSMLAELGQTPDAYTKNILISGIAVVLSLSMRFFERQHTDTSTSRRRITPRFDRLLNEYIASRADDKQLPTVKWCAAQLHLSTNYFGDLVKGETGLSAYDYIQRRLVDEAKLLLCNNSRSINDIAYSLGYRYPHHLTRVFKRVTGCTPNQYRRQIVEGGEERHATKR